MLIACGKKSSSDLPSANSSKEYKEVNRGKQTETIDTRILVKKGTLRFETINAIESRQKIGALVTVFKGYFGSDHPNQYDDIIEHEIEVRIHSIVFDAFINRLTSKIEYINRQSITIEDVTGKYYDIEARLNAKKTLEERYLGLLKKAETVEGIMNIENELGKVRSDIESIERQFKILQSQISYSTLSITFYQTIEQTSALGRKAGQAFTLGWNMLLEVFVGILNIWPFLIIIGIV